MKRRANSPDRALAPALEALANLQRRELDQFLSNAWMDGLRAHSKIEAAPILAKSVAFYQHFLPLRQNLVAMLADGYRRYYKVALAQPSLTGPTAHDWALVQLHPFIYAAADWISEWYILACSGKNRFIRPMESAEVAPGTTISLTVYPVEPYSVQARSWRAPAWLFSILPPLTGIGPMKRNHIPATDSAQELSAAHSRLILKGAKRVLWRELAEVIDIARNEETAAAAAIPVGLGKQQQETKEKHTSPRNLEGLGPKQINFSDITYALTDKQHLAFSLKYEYGLGIAEIAERMGIHHTTAYEHLQAANRKIDRATLRERYRSRKAKNVRE